MDEVPGSTHEPENMAGMEPRSPKKSRSRVTPSRILLLSAVIILASIPATWIEGTTSAGSVSYDGIQVALFGLCSLGVASSILLGAFMLSRGKKVGASILVICPAVSSLLFAIFAVLAVGTIRSLVNGFVPEEIATANVGPAIWILLGGGVLALFALIWGLSRPVEEMDHGIALRLWLTLPKALLAAAKSHLQQT